MVGDLALARGTVMPSDYMENRKEFNGIYYNAKIKKIASPEKTTRSFLSNSYLRAKPSIGSTFI